MKKEEKTRHLSEEHKRKLSEHFLFRYLKKEVCYASYHRRVYRKKGKATKCEKCHTLDAKQYEWANVSGRYEDVDDYIQLCVSCHKKFDHKGGTWSFHNLKPKQCLSCSGMFDPRSRSQLRCGSRYEIGSCAHKHFNEYHKKRAYEKRKRVQ